MIKLKQVLNYAVSSVLLILLVIVIFNRQTIVDTLSLVNYSPSVEIEKLATDSGMSDKGRKIFYVHRPMLLNEEEFNISCTDFEETIVLGCYNGKNIFIYNVDNTNLDGIKEVTAAHEMLHAQYDRLGNNERERVNDLLNQQLKLITDERILKNIDNYRKKDPNIVINEVHSIFGTEVSDLSSELEKYYSRYFKDRSLVVEKSMSYEKVFTDIKNKVLEYDTKLEKLKNDINALEEELEIRSNDLISWSIRLDELKTSNLVVEYNSQVNSYNNSVERYRKDLNFLRSLIYNHNTLVEERNEFALQQNELYKSIDSKAKEL